MSFESFSNTELAGGEKEINLTRVEISPNEGQRKDERVKVPSVIIETLSGHKPPEAVSRLSAAKCRFLVESIAQVRKGSKVLELFGGSNLSTVKIAERTDPKNITSIDLHYDVDPDDNIYWKYVPEENFRRAAELEGLKVKNLPKFVPADASELPFTENEFEFVVAPDSPRSGTDRLEDNASSGEESELSYEKQRDLFLSAVEESYRVLKQKGVFTATAPLSWAKTLKEKSRFSVVQIFSHEPLDESVTQIEMGGNFRFNTKNKDPIVYIRAVKK
jgi:hypothetical protein